ncbi:MAG: pyridoxal phosphate-dependent aminotransferase [Bacteroidales bacterium]|nr:pyridoxal phosphate-dependent aminotransferase [Bacteroidales bacterium]
MFDFDHAPDRRDTGSYKWDSYPEGVIPMWVADMDFRTAPAIVEALRSRVDHGVFGYTLVGDEYYDAVTGWFARRHGWTIDPAMIIYTSGVVPAVSAIIKAMTRPGDKVVLQTPAYNCFFSSIRNNGCEASRNELLRQADGSYRIDFDDLEARCADPAAKLLILCNPHNPTGRIWSAEELRRIAGICAANGVFVISDEIHCELTYNGREYTPFGTLAPDGLRYAVCVSPSKAFNTAGLQIANIVASDADVRAKIDRAINDNEVCDVNPFGVAGTIAAYGHGEAWLDELRGYLWQNWLTVRDFFAKELPAYGLTPLESTYLVWIDCRHTGIGSDRLSAMLIEGGVALSPGSIYGDDGYMRLNIACPRARLEEGLRRIAAVLGKL